LSSAADPALVLLALSNLALLGTGHLANSIRLLGLQGAALGALVVLISPDVGAGHLALALGVGGLKGLLYPWVLTRVLRRIKATAEEDPLVGYASSFLAGVLALAAAFAIAPSLTPPGAALPTLALPVALTTMITGLTVTMTHRTALAQVVGYVVLENGIFLFALCLVGGLPLILELGGLLEVFFAVFVMGIALDRISREFSTIDVDALGQLRG
jgi:hydrogenase-4 component E